MMIDLDWPEVRLAAYLGIDRYVRNTSRDRLPLNGQARDAWQAHVVGAWGEMVVAKAMGVYWAGGPARPDHGAPDVGTFHVRATDRPDKRLILHEWDDDDAVYVLVVPDHLPRFRIVGCCTGREGKRPEHWWTPNDRPPAFFVPHHALRPLEADEPW